MHGFVVCLGDVGSFTTTYTANNSAAKTFTVTAILRGAALLFIMRDNSICVYALTVRSSGIIVTAIKEDDHPIGFDTSTTGVCTFSVGYAAIAFVNFKGMSISSN